MAEAHSISPVESAPERDAERDSPTNSSADSGPGDLSSRLAQAEEMIRAIHFGEVDALVVKGPHGPRVYTLEGADHPYRVMVEQMHEGTVALDRDGVVLYANPHFLQMVGARAEAITGSRFRDHLSSVDETIFEALLESAAARGYSSGEIHVRDAERQFIPLRVSLTRLNAAGIETVSMLVSDLREQLRSEAIVKEEQLSRLILEQAGEAIVVIDPNGLIVRRSDSARSLVHQTILLKAFDQIFPLHVAGEPLSAHRICSAVAANQPMRGVEASLVHPDGRTSALLVSASALRGGSQELLGCVVTLTDITERKRAEDALARSNSDLRQFAYSASHDLREPVRQLAVFSELLQKKFEGTLGEEGAYLIQHAVESAHRVERLLQDLLAYVQAADAPQQLPDAVDAGEIVRKTADTFEEQIRQTGARVEWDPLPRLAVHEVHLVQLFQNLISNALKYRSEAAPRIRIRAEPIGRMWRISVEDNGIGIRPEYQSQIFGLFQRLHGAGRYSGSGIGLAICQKIVQRYGGNIWVESEPGRGSKFVFTAPGETRGTRDGRTASPSTGRG